VITAKDSAAAIFRAIANLRATGDDTKLIVIRHHGIGNQEAAG
jgi:hypothetical protein